MKGIIEASVYLVLFAIICMFSIDFIRSESVCRELYRGMLWGWI